MISATPEAMPAKTISLSNLIIPKFWPVFADVTHTHKILTSGRAGTKSSAAAIEAVYRIISRPRCSVVVLRKRHNKLRKTVYKEILRAIDRLGLSKRDFRITVSPMEITYRSADPEKDGNTIYFAGSDNIDDTKGIIDGTRPICLVLLDEVTEFFTVGQGADELQNIEATFIRGNQAGFQMLYLYNPPKNPNAPVAAWCRQMETRPDTVHVHSDYRDVPPEWLGAKLIQGAEIMRQVDDRQYRWVWLGQAVGVDDLIYFMFDRDKHVRAPAHETYQEIDVGCDYGQQNATTYQAFGLTADGRLEGCGEYYYSGRDAGRQKTPGEYAADFCALCETLSSRYRCGTFVAYIDPSARGLMEEIRHKARDVRTCRIILRAADNDVALGIARTQAALQYGALVISPDQPGAIREFGLYEYDRKSIEKGQETPVKVNDHAMDAIRYAVMGCWSYMKRYLPEAVAEITAEGARIN